MAWLGELLDGVDFVIFVADEVEGEVEGREHPGEGSIAEEIFFGNLSVGRLMASDIEGSGDGVKSGNGGELGDGDDADSERAEGAAGDKLASKFWSNFQV